VNGRKLHELESLITDLTLCPTIRRELAMLRASRADRARKVQADREEEARRKRTKAQRVARFRDFVSQRLVFGGSFRVQESQVRLAYNRWASEQNIPPTDRLDDAELRQCMLSLPNVSAGLVAPTHAVGTPSQGYAGVRILLDDESADDVVREIERASERAAAQQRESEERTRSYQRRADILHEGAQRDRRASEALAAQRKG